MSAADEPYVAVIFSSVRTGADEEGYSATAERMEALAAEQPGYLGIESARGADGFGITVSYWRTEGDARAWKRQSEHLVAQADGRTRWYSQYRVRVATVTREYAREPAHEILHLAVPTDWDAALAEGVYRISTRGRTLDEEGFVHCSYPAQLEGVANRFYGDVAELLILHVDTRRLGAEVRVEPPADGVEELFPHVYGPIPTSAVVGTTPWHRDDDGVWRLPSR